MKHSKRQAHCSKFAVMDHTPLHIEDIGFASHIELYSSTFKFTSHFIIQ